MEQNDKFYKLKSEIEKGQLRYTVKSVILLCLYITLGRFIGSYVFGDESVIDKFWAELPSSLILLVLIGGVFSLIIFQFKLIKYKKDSNDRNNT